MLTLWLGGILLLLSLFLWLGWFFSERRTYHHSPYSDLPLRFASDISYAAIGKLFLFLRGFHQYDNRMCNIQRVAICRETGRVFFDALDWAGRVHLDWNFLSKRYPGTYVSWGSLSYNQQEAVRKAHQTLTGFQIKESSPHPSPRMIERKFALTKPGPLYVDLSTFVLLGWKSVPGTDLEVLIVQKPKRPLGVSKTT